MRQGQGSPSAFGQRHGAAHSRVAGAPARSWIWLMSAQGHSRSLRPANPAHRDVLSLAKIRSDWVWSRTSPNRAATRPVSTFSPRGVG